MHKLDIDKHLQEIKQKGYTVIKNFLEKDKIEKYTKLVADIEKEVILERVGVKKSKDDRVTSAEVYMEGKKPYMLRVTGKLITRPEGQELIKYFEDQFKRINDNIRFLKDRVINQKKDYQGLLPHQDNSASFHKEVTNEFYSAYISLSDTTEQNGCLWVEDIQPKRTESLGYCDTGCASGEACHCLALKITPTDMMTFKGHKMVPIELLTGDCIMFDGYLLHGTAANLTNNIRQTLIFGYGVLEEKDLAYQGELFQKYFLPHKQKLLHK